jgi:hypothetical protein
MLYLFYYRKSYPPLKAARLLGVMSDCRTINHYFCVIGFARRLRARRINDGSRVAAELAKVTGHRDLRVLSRVYYAPDMQDVASKLD